VAFNVVNRRIHYWAAFAAAAPLLVMIASGLLLQTKKHWSWVQPAEKRGTPGPPRASLDDLLRAAMSRPDLGVRGWDDVTRIDIRPDRGLAKLTLRGSMEVQVDLGSGEVLQTAVRRSDLIESVHDGSFFGGDWTKLGLFLPAGIVLLVLWMTGLWMWWVPFVKKRRLRARRRAAA
jgi:uncharacterized iron-regulated membrane protein